MTIRKAKGMRISWYRMLRPSSVNRVQPARPHRRGGILFLVLLMVLQVACSSSAGVSHQSTVSLSPTPAISPTPLIPRQTVHFLTSDHLKLAGWLWNGGRSIVLICSHETRGDKSNWIDAAPSLAAHGYTVLAFDFRGYADSQGPLDRSRFDLDLLAAITFMRSYGAQKILLIGASLGGIVSLMVAARAHVNGVITLSGGYYRDQAPPTLTVEEVRAITVPKLFIASQDDPFALESRLVYRDAVEPKELHLYSGSEHGTRIFDGPNGPDLSRRILAFVQQATR